MGNGVFESTTWWVLVVLQCAVVYLIMLNGHLKGRLTPYVDCVLGLFILVVLGLLFVLFSWKVGVFHLFASFGIGAAAKPLAAKSAAWLWKL